MEYPFDVAAARSTSGLMLSEDLSALGVTTERLQREMRSGRLIRPRRGVYVESARWRSLDADQRYRMTVRAAALTRQNPLVLSHHSAAVAHGLPCIDGWPSDIHGLRPGASGGSPHPGVVLHTGGPPADPVSVDGLTVTSLERTLIDMASSSSLATAVGMLDHALRTNATTKDQLRRELDHVAPRYGRTRARFAIEFASPLGNRPGESLSRVRIFELGFAAPELQVEFDLPGGRRALVDFYWRRRDVIGEFDGRAKYERDEFTAGEAPGEIVWREKRREDQLRRTVHGFTRWTWAIVSSPELFARHLSDAGVPRATRVRSAT